MRFGARRGALALGIGLAAVWLTSCGNTLQDQPIATSLLEKLIMVRPFPVYWLGTHFDGLALAGVTEDPSGAFMVQYGDCAVGGQYTCVSPVEIITNPDNSFRPGGTAPSRALPIRGVRGVLTRNGDAVTLATGPVVVDLYAQTPSLARSAVALMTPINRTAAPGEALPPASASTDFADTPLRSQLPPPADALPATLER